MLRNMMNKDQLAALLQTVPVEAVAKEAGVSTKTIYRLRHKAHSPTLSTVESIVSAVRRLKAKRSRVSPATDKAAA